MKFLTMMIMSGLMGASVFGKSTDSCSTDSGKIAPQNKICLPVWGADLIKNGDFQLNNCTTPTCTWDKTTFVPANLPNWKPHPKIEIGKGNKFNSNWPSPSTNFVAELDPGTNTCIKQKLVLKKGTYNLSFDWAAQDGASVGTSQLIVKVNGQTITPIPLEAPDKKIQKANFLFVLKQSVYNGSIEICGAGPSDGKGASVDNVKLISYNNCK